MTEGTYRRLKAQLKENQSLSPQLLNLITPVRRAAEKQGRITEARLLNVFEFALLFHFETACLFEDMADYNASLRGQLYARLLVLAIYENTLKLQSLLSRRFQEDLSTAGFNEGEIENVRSVHRAFIAIYEDCKRKFKKVRDGAIAHRDASAEVQLRLINKAQITVVTDLAIEFLKETSKLTKVLQIWVNKSLLAASPAEPLSE